jgi:hypothetical protein
MFNRSVLKLILVSLCVFSSAEAFSAVNRPLSLEKVHAQKGLCREYDGLCMERSKNRSIAALSMNALSTSGGGEEEVPFASKIRAFTKKNSFLLGMASAVSFARAFPSVSKQTNEWIKWVITAMFSSITNHHISVGSKWRTLKARTFHWEIWCDNDFSLIWSIARTVRVEKCSRQYEIKFLGSIWIIPSMAFLSGCTSDQSN